MYVIYTCLNIFYFIISWYYLQGSPIQFLFKTKIVSQYKNNQIKKMNLLSCIKRLFFWYLLYIISFGLISIINIFVFLLSKKNQFLHDMPSNTIVVKNIKYENYHK